MIRSIAALAAILLMNASYLFAQADPQIVRWALSIAPGTVRESASFEARLTAELGSGWHLYSLSQAPGGPIPTSIRFKDGQPFRFTDRIRASAPLKTYDNNFRMETEYYEEKAEFILPVTALAGAADAREMIVAVTFQACNEENCLPPETVEVAAPLTKGAAPVTTPAPKQPGPEAMTAKPAVGDIVPDFDFVDFAGKTRKFSEFKGRIVLLDFWATWCGPCLKDIPKLKVFSDRYKASGFEILGLNAEQLGDDQAQDAATLKEAADRARQIVTTRGASWTHANSATSTDLARRVFDVKALPTKILVDKDGRIVAFLGEKDDLDKAVTALMEKK